MSETEGRVTVIYVEGKNFCTHVKPIGISSTRVRPVLRQYELLLKSLSEGVSNVYLINRN